MNIPDLQWLPFLGAGERSVDRAQAASEQAATCAIGSSATFAPRGWRPIPHISAWGSPQEFLKKANLALKLAQTRYQLGLSSIVELSQAQFQQTDAAIGNTDAQYQYRLSLATLNYQIGATP